MKIKTVVSVLPLTLLAMVFLSSETMGQRVVQTSEGPVVVDYPPQPEDDDEIEIPQHILDKLVPEGAIVVLPTYGDLRRAERKERNDPFDNSNYQELRDSLKLALDSDFLLNFMQLEGQQTDDLSELLQSHQKRVAKLMEEAKKKKVSDPEIASAVLLVVDQEQVSFSKSVKEKLTADQQTRLPVYLGSQGAPILLLQTNLGDALELTDAQKQQIKTQSDKLAQEMEEFLRIKRLESEKILTGTLTEKQLAHLKEVRGEVGVTDYSFTPFDMLLRNHKIEPEKK